MTWQEPMQLGGMPMIRWPFLPHLLRATAEAFNLETALHLAHDFGGTRVRLPRTARTDHPIAKSIGLDVLRHLIRINGPGDCLVPLGPMSNAAIRQRLIEQLFSEGRSNNEIARILQIHERTVRACRSRIRAEAERQEARMRQMTLFR